MLKPYHTKDQLEAGCDEAGRGCLAGPVFAAAVVLPNGFKNKLLNDSKQLTEKQRDQLRPIIEKECQWAVAQCTPEEIDEINILNASILSMHRALDILLKKTKPNILLIDGNRFKPYKKLQYLTVIKGDAIYMSIAAASILAKTHRDEYMEAAHLKHPHFGWDKNKGYPTLSHRQGIRLHGPCKLHRKSFTLLPRQLVLL
ncbi:MAG: ribonuclease HII [Flavobacteriaceae bacterium]|nr:ribonuclease HII [Flavobacteriaceae bacterium]